MRYYVIWREGGKTVVHPEPFDNFSTALTFSGQKPGAQVAQVMTVTKGEAAEPKSAAKGVRRK